MNRSAKGWPAYKLIGDLERPTKIFVYKITPRNLTEPELDALHTAKRNYGDATLLHVQFEDEGHPNGSVELVAPGLLIGYIDRFAVDRSSADLGPATSSWLSLCQAAYRLWRASGEAAAPSAA